MRIIELNENEISNILNDLLKRSPNNYGEYEGKVKIGKLDIDESPKTTQENRIVSVPTMILFKNGAKDDMRIGAIPREELKQWIEEAIS